MALLALSTRSMMGLKKRHGVAGLISIIAIVTVFGLAAAASLQLNSQQTSLITSTSNMLDLQGKKGRELLIFQFISCDPITHSITFSAESRWSERSRLDSAIFIDLDPEPDIVTNSVYASHTISPMQPSSFTVQATIGVQNADLVWLVTELGNKFSVLQSFQGC